MKKQNKKTKRSNKAKQKRPVSSFRFVGRARFLPAIAISLLATVLWMHPQTSGTNNIPNLPGVLAKATSVSHSGLLAATNSHRTANGSAALALNSVLNSAAQAKANDMVARGYWSHVTPDGKQPWWFITNAGYKYLSAGENLAYGFMTSDSTVTGWMNSPGHKTNLLNSAFTEVGFGYADTDNYIYDGVDHGPQTIVVAMYAKPQALAAAAPTAPAPAPAPKPASAEPQAAPVQSQSEQEPAAEPEQEPAEEKPEEETIALSEEEEIIAAAPTNVNRIQLLTGGNVAWSVALVSLAVTASIGLWMLHKGVHIRRYLLAGEKFLAHHHIHLDLTVLSVIYLGFVLMSTTGTIR